MIRTIRVNSTDGASAVSQYGAYRGSEFGTSASPLYNRDKASWESSGLGSLLIGTQDRDLRDLAISEFTADNALRRDLYKLAEQNKFNADQADLKFERDKWIASNEYQMAMKDMKLAGLNPILAYQQGPASGFSSANASSASGGASSGSGFQSTDMSSAVGSLIIGLGLMAAGFYKAGLASSDAALDRASRAVTHYYSNNYVSR